ncbi:hypothetical protein Y032_0003g1509 [Ancylostoma ceylanicum]|uniref:STIM1/2 Orai1-activating region domain-containing protein n=2 Tax=Ancylostoma ceylanicum TaxID=53326 RepID=A0A016VYA5_9BILA|nr:hypothetical protein Y032_0003g1509 [Ancylostoma ceylanicum]
MKSVLFLRLEENGVGGVPLALQPLLRKTCEVEMAFLEKQKQECVKEMRDAIELVDRLQKKQSSVISSLKLATGASSSSDQVDSKIFALKSRMDKIQVLTRETQERWLQIESLCGFPVFYINETIPIMHPSASSAHFYTANSATSSVSSKSLASSGGSTAHASNHTLSAAVNTSAPVVPQKPPTFLSGSSANGSSLLNGSSENTNGAVVGGPIRPQRVVTEDTLSINSTEGKKKKGFLKFFKKSSSKSSLMTTPE